MIHEAMTSEFASRRSALWNIRHMTATATIYKTVVAINNGEKPYRSCTMPEMYGPTDQPNCQAMLSTLLTVPCWCSGVCSMQNALYKGLDIFINAERTRTANPAIQIDGTNPIMSIKITLPSWVNATVRILPPRRVVST